MSRPTQEMVEDNLITWQVAIYELHREIDKLDQELDILRSQLNRVIDEASRLRWPDTTGS